MKPLYEIEESVSGELMRVRANNPKLAVKRLIDFLPINEATGDWNYDIAIRRVDENNDTAVQV